MPKTKRITNYCNYATRNCDTGEGFAILKSTIFNYCDTVWDIYADERVTILVFANAFISVTYVLNGRKVTAKLLKRLEKMKI